MIRELGMKQLATRSLNFGRLLLAGFALALSVLALSTERVQAHCTQGGWVTFSMLSQNTSSCRVRIEAHSCVGNVPAKFRVNNVLVATPYLTSNGYQDYTVFRSWTTKSLSGAYSAIFYPFGVVLEIPLGPIICGPKNTPLGDPTGRRSSGG